ncbi:hypothetical protein AJ88_31275 [Mesorhizobium amorphae CCBAU 01583]|nr:hypothetical protein AJ88_31275 [Mesorhizobium amorphae CCBAU 01583]
MTEREKCCALLPHPPRRRRFSAPPQRQEPRADETRRRRYPSISEIKSKGATMASSASRFDDGTFVGFARRHVFVTVFGVAVPLLVFACFIGYPIVYTIYLSFFEWNGMAPQKKFVGFANYAYLLHDKYFYIALVNNAKWLIVSLVFPVSLGFLIAYVMKARLVFAPSLLRTIVFFPVTMSLIAVGLMFLLILNPVFGAFDTLLRSVGLGFMVHEWFGDYRIALYTLAVISGWAFTGMPMIFYFAGLGDVPKETFDAARIEGAGHWRMIRSVALPQLARHRDHRHADAV